MWPFTPSPAASSSPNPDPTPSTSSAPAASADKCPVDHSTRQAWLDASSSSTPHPFHPEAKTPPPTGSASRLSQSRVISSIPRAPVSHPGPSQPPSEHAIPSSSSSSAASSGAHKDEAGNWVYPSEQQFFNAMLRKNHNPKAQDMRTIVPIHNAVNEKAWEEVLKWESPFGSERCGGPKLVSFVGKPKERTPKAWFKTALGYTPPFDRHDWLVDRCGTHVRYVIDFYTGRAGDDGKVSFYLDVRPAVDNWDGVQTRLSGWWNQP